MDREKRILELEKTLAEAQAELKELKKPLNSESLKDGDWLHIECFGSSYVIRYKHVNSSQGGAYIGCNIHGTSLDQKFFEDENNFFTHNLTGDKSSYKIRYAAHDEIKAALRKIAEHKGFIQGANYKPIRNHWPILEKDKVKQVKYMAGYLALKFANNKYFLYSADTNEEDYIYYDGEWAELVKEQEPKDGNWYKVRLHGEDYIIKYKYINGDKGGAYLGASLSERKSYIENDDLLFYFGKDKHSAAAATEHEIRETLFKIAIAKGLTTGVRFKSVCFPGAYELPNPITKLKNIGFDPIEYNLYMAGVGYIYYNKNHKWSEVIKEFEIVPGYPVEYNNSNYCRINGMNYFKGDIVRLVSTMNHINCDDKQMVIHSLNVGCNGQYKLTVKDLDNLISNWPTDF